MKNKNLPIDDNWYTPPNVYNKLNEEFGFDHDPCPAYEGEITPERDGLINDWGQCNYVNPPYSRKLKEAFVHRAVEFMKKGKTSVMLLPVSTSTTLFNDVIKPNAAEIRFLKGRIKFQKMDENGNRFTPKNGGMHDSMIVVFKPNNHATHT